MDRPAGSLLSVNVGLPQDVAWGGRIVHTAVWKRPVEGPRMVRRLNIDGDGQGDLAGHGGEHRAVFVYQIESYRYWQEELGRDDFSYGQFGENLTVTGLADDQVCIGDRYRIGAAVFEVTQPRVTCYRVGIRMADLRIPALPAGWRDSFRALLGPAGALGAGGNAGLTAVSPPPAWPGFRPLAVTATERESESVVSVYLADPTGAAVPPALPGQFVTLRLIVDKAAPPLLRSYSLSGAPGAGTYRISVKREPHGAGSRFVHTRVHAGDVLEAAAPRGTFILQPGDSPVLLISAGVGATPVLAMLHALAGTRSGRDVWWLHGARNRVEEPET